MPEQALFCSSRLLSHTGKRLYAEGTGCGWGERSGSHPAALSEDVRATAWKPVALEGKRTR